MDQSKLKVSFYNLGCKVNLADISRIGKQFQDLGHDIVNFEEHSDVVLVNTCTVTHRADADCRKIVRRALKKSPEAYIGVVGCFAQLKPDEVIKIDGVDGVFGQKEKFQIPELIQDFSKTQSTNVLVGNMQDIPFHTSAVSDNAGRTRANFKIQDGCEYNCTFCTIPMARGGFRSMDFDKIIPELEDFVEKGFSEVVLSGINLGEYKATTGEKFSDVVNLLQNQDLPLRYRISSLEPNLFKDEIVELLSKGERFVPHFHIPLQSGSQDILMKMKRRYRTKNYSKLVNNLFEKIEDVCIGADVITGFPGESDEHFQETYDFIKTNPINYLHVFTYSERDNTVAASLDNPVPHDIRKERTKILRDLSSQKLNEFYDSQVGKIKSVIPEIYNENIGVWRGHTDNYVNVKFAGSKDLEKKPTKIKLLENQDSMMLGELI